MNMCVCVCVGFILLPFSLTARVFCAQERAPPRERVSACSRDDEDDSSSSTNTNTLTLAQ